MVAYKRYETTLRTQRSQFGHALDVNELTWFRTPPSGGVPGGARTLNDPNKFLGYFEGVCDEPPLRGENVTNTKEIALHLLVRNADFAADCNLQHG